MKRDESTRYAGEILIPAAKPGAKPRVVPWGELGTPAHNAVSAPATHRVMSVTSWGEWLLEPVQRRRAGQRVAAPTLAPNQRAVPRDGLDAGVDGAQGRARWDVAVGIERGSMLVAGRECLVKRLSTGTVVLMPNGAPITRWASAHALADAIARGVVFD